MGVIVEYILGDKMLQLGPDEQFMRPMLFGPQWRKLRIAMRCCVYHGPASFNGALGVGLTVSNKQYYGSDSDMCFVSCNHPAGNQSLVTYGDRFYYTTANTRAYSKVGSTLSAGAVGSNDSGFVAYCVFGSYPVRYLTCTDFTRSGQDVTVSHWIRVASGGSVPTITDRSREDFMSDLETETVMSNLVLPGYACNGTSAYTGSGLLDSVWIRWFAAAPAKFLISDLAVCRFS